MSGLLSPSRFSALSAARAFALLISAEVSLSLSLLHLPLLTHSFSILAPHTFPLILLPLVLLGAALDSSRTPFDIIEAESELIAGLFSEYPSSLFLLWSFSEYAKLVYLSTLLALFLTLSLPFASLSVCALCVLSLGVLSRATLPRSRLDSSLRFA